ncbi:MAG TPA: 5'-nucleotidase [Chitinophagales bacterium]|nr:5'-nucleotidase [Chitinophagales bacterium]
MKNCIRFKQEFRCYLAILLLAGASSCAKQLRPVKAEAAYFKIDGTGGADSSIIAFIHPYRDSLRKEMTEVVAISSIMMEKGKPESLLGNFVADLLLEKGKQYDSAADCCILNYGSLRLPFLPAGEITKGMIYELMPFDNFLVLIELRGEVVRQLLDYIAFQGGWPVAGIKFKIRDGKSFDILINDLPLQPGKIYRVVISDYLADGGDNLSMLRNEKRKNFGIFIRDVILEYLKEQTQQGKLISSQLDNRIMIE